MDNREQLGKRILMSVIGVLICGISVGMFKRAELGVDPFQSLMSGLNAVIPIRFGTLYLAANALLLLFALLNDRRKIGIATLINLLFFGYVAEFVQKTLEKAFPHMSLAARLVLLLAAVVLLCLSTAFYFTADLGVSTYDAVSLIISQKQDRVPFHTCRIISDVACVAAGILLCLAAGYSVRQIGASVGIGTIITAFFMGPLIEWFNVHAARPFLERGSSREGRSCQ